MFFKSRPIPDRTSLVLKTGPVEVSVRRSARARNYRLTLPATGVPVLTLPPKGSWAQAEDFLKRHRGWLESALARAPSAIVLVPGALVPIRGVEHRIVPTGTLRGAVRLEDGPEGALVHVPGDAAHLERRLTDFLRAEALADVSARSAVHAARLGVTVKAVRIRAQSSRWGSCSSSGTITYNWRLIGAPPYVLDYVAAHEVAHLVEMNHSPAFWKTVEKTLPGMERGRAWLKANGARLMTLGA